jgi:hypothetical protein
MTPNEMIQELVDSTQSPLLSKYSESQGGNVNIDVPLREWASSVIKRPTLIKGSKIKQKLNPHVNCTYL